MKTAYTCVIVSRMNCLLCLSCAASSKQWTMEDKLERAIKWKTFMSSRQLPPRFVRPELEVALFLLLGRRLRRLRYRNGRRLQLRMAQRQRRGLRPAQRSYHPPGLLGLL